MTHSIGIEVESIVAVSKFSQNKDERDRLGVVTALKDRARAETSAAMLEAVIPQR